MKISILGSGAMGSLYGGYLSKKNDVTVIDVNRQLVDAINKAGIRIREKDGCIGVYHPEAIVDSSELPKQDLIIVFVKSMYTLDALEKNKHLIGECTYLMTLQNGAGHESKLLQFADKSHVIIGTTQHNSSIVSIGEISHGGVGITNIGLLDGGNDNISHIKAAFDECGFECHIESNIQWQIWHKLFTNTAASSLTGLFQVPLGFIHNDKNANYLMRKLCEESVAVASALGLEFDLDEVIEEVDIVCINAQNGYTSIYADIRDGRKTEVDTISGSVVEAAKLLSINVPYHDMVVRCIHALENKNKEK